MDNEAPHIDALARAKDAGFTFLHLRDEQGVTAIHAERRSPGNTIETITLRARSEATAARFRIEDYQRGGNPLWQHTGSVLDVITELLALPDHGSPGAPGPTRPASSTLRLPGR